MGSHTYGNMHGGTKTTTAQRWLVARFVSLFSPCFFRSDDGSGAKTNILQQTRQADRSCRHIR